MIGEYIVGGESFNRAMKAKCVTVHKSLKDSKLIGVKKAVPKTAESTPAHLAESSSFGTPVNAGEEERLLEFKLSNADK